MILLKKSVRFSASLRTATKKKKQKDQKKLI